MKENYQLKTDEIIKNLGDTRPRLLLHSCCGPCSTYVLEYLTQYFDISVLFYNPCIQPPEEYAKRLEHQERVLARFGVSLLPCFYDGESFSHVSEGYESCPEGGERCTRCFLQRLGKTAEQAAKGGFEYFCTTLSVSPHKDAGRLNAIGAALSEKHGVKWLYSDFKKRGGYQRSIALSREMELYRQDYCGCLYSRAEG